jgi:hypothetical protein
MDEQAKNNKDTVTKFKTIDKVLENIDSKVTEVGSSNHQVLRKNLRWFLNISTVIAQVDKICFRILWT